MIDPRSGATSGDGTSRSQGEPCSPVRTRGAGPALALPVESGGAAARDHEPRLDKSAVPRPRPRLGQSLAQVLKLARGNLHKLDGDSTPPPPGPFGPGTSHTEAPPPQFDCAVPPGWPLIPGGVACRRDKRPRDHGKVTESPGVCAGISRGCARPLGGRPKGHVSRGGELGEGRRSA